MISVSFTDLLPNANEAFVDALGKQWGVVAGVASLALGVLFAAAIDRFVPHQEYDTSKGERPHQDLYRVGFVSMLAIALHNFPEGIATFMAGYENATLGISIAIAIALHNIPEGITVAMPVYFATGSRRKAIWYTFLSGIAEPIGALLAFLVLRPLINNVVMGALFGIVSGIMLYIAIEELVPSSRQYGYDRYALIAMFVGICIMPLTHIILKRANNMMTIVGIGTGTLGTVTLDVFEKIKETDSIILQTEHIPLAKTLKEQGIAYETLDRFYENAADFTAFLAQAIGFLKEHEKSILCLLGDLATNTLLRAYLQEAPATLVPGVGFLGYSLSRATPLLQEENVYFACTATDYDARFAGNQGIVITELDSPYLAADIILQLQRFYPAETPASLLHEEKQFTCTLSTVLEQLEENDWDYSTSLVLPRTQEKETYDFVDFCQIIATLRGENGCPWDKEQTHESLRANLIEECYELIAAIDERDTYAMMDELGDVLMQVVMHAQIAKEQGNFDIIDVSDTIAKKMIRRHPHIFGDTKVSSTEDVLQNWEAIKKEEKQHSSYADTLVDVPSSMTPLLRAEKIQKRAASAGFDWDDYKGALEKVEEEITELKEAIEGKKGIEEEAGDLLFAIVNALRKIGIDGEVALQAANNKFIRRFSAMEKRAMKMGKKLEKMPLDAQEALWQAVKCEEIV